MRSLRHIASIIVVALAACTGAESGAPPAASGSSGVIGPGEQAYEIAATFDEDRARLTGTQVVSFTNTRPDQLDSVSLRLWPNGQSGCPKPFMRISQIEGGEARPPSVGCTLVVVDLDEPLAQGERGQLSMRFTDVVPGDWNFRYGTTGAAWMLGNPFPILALTDEGGTHDEPYTLQGESMYSTTASWKVALTYPRDLKIATTGMGGPSTLASEGRVRTTFTSEDERDFAFAIGRFGVTSTTAEGVQLRYFSQPDPKVAPKEVLGWAREAMESFTERYGPYDQPEVDLVEGAWEATGNEFPSLLMVAPTRDVVFHEIAHLWWYSMVGDNQYANPWVDEVFAEFSTRRLKGTNGGCDTQRPFRGTPGNVPLHADMGTFEQQGHYVDTIYVGGPCVLERLRRDWGDERFDAFMSGLLETYRGKVVDTCGVIDAMREAAPPGYDFDDFLADARLASADC